MRQRPQFTNCLAVLEADDALIVWKLDRLGRSLHDLIGFLDDLKERKIQFQSLTESIDTKTPTGRAMWQMIGILTELERSLIQERTKAGRAAAQARGVKMGRKPKLSPQQIEHAQKMIDQGKALLLWQSCLTWHGQRFIKLSVIKDFTNYSSS